MREIDIAAAAADSEPASFRACIATVLELPLDEVPAAPADHRRWFAARGLGVVPVADVGAFLWAGPWIGWHRCAPATGVAAAQSLVQRLRLRRRRPVDGRRRAVVMFGVPAGVVFDPAAAIAPGAEPVLDGGAVIAALDIALAPPPQLAPPTTIGTLESIWIAPAAGVAARSLDVARAIAGHGLDGDRHVLGTGTFASGQPGSALTLIAAEVCDSFTPPLGPDDHRRNLVVRGIDLDRLIGRDFWIGAVRCRGKRACEPCTVIQRYAGRPILRPLVHRGGIRADILDGGELRVGDRVRIER
jgi:hypothetical protein